MAKAGARLPAPPPRPGARGGVSAEVAFRTDAHAIVEALCPRRGLLPDGLKASRLQTRPMRTAADDLL